MASSKKVRGLLIEIGGDTTKLQTALKDVDKTTASLSKELKGINTLLKFDPSNTTLLNQKTKVLSESIEETEKRLSALQQAQEKLDGSGIDKNSAEYRDLQREIESTTQKLSKLKTESSNWTKAGQALENFGNKVYSVGSVIDSVGNKLTMGLTLPIVALGTYATKSAIDFESAFAGVRKTVDATEEEYTELRNGILEMSKELPASAEEIAAVAEAAGQLGIQKSSLLSFTRTMVDLGEASNMTSDEAATALARFANITQMDQNEFSRLGSVVTDLGNKLASTESEIVAMGLRLAGAGAQVGMTEDQILSFAGALSSVGIEAEMGGSAFSKVMVEMQLAVETGGDSLNQFAEIAGMSAEKFKRAFKDDAATAIIAFINGLGNLDGTGKSAIAVLDEMGLSEVRLRDTLLRASGAGNLFNESLRIGSQAWQENTALTKEATERYKTTESQIEMAKNKIKALAISMGNELLPHINNLLDFLGDLTDNFSDMSEEEQEAILKNIALVAAIGPLVKIFGTLTKGIGKVTGGLGTFSKAVVLAKNGIGDATGSVATLAKVIQSLTSPIGLLITVTGGLLTVGTLLANQMTDEEKKMKELNDSIDNLVDSRKELEKERQTELESSLIEMDHVEMLSDELRSLVDANGKVKEGYEDRVNFILGELNDALGTEYQLNGDIVSQYGELVESIDLVIAKKRASLILQTQEEAWKQAIEDEATASKNLADAKETLTQRQEEYNAALEEYNQYLSEHQNDKDLTFQKEYQELNGAMLDSKNAMNEALDTYEKASKSYQDIYEDITTYETNSIRAQSDSIEEINKIIETNTRVTEENGKQRKATLAETIAIDAAATEASKLEYKERIKNADDAEKQILEATRKNKQNVLNSTLSTLKEMTSTTNNNSDEVIDSWKKLATTSVGQYQAALSTLPEDTIRAVVKMTGVAYDNTTAVATAWANLATTSEAEFKSQISHLPQDMQDQIISIANSVNENAGFVTEETKKMTDSVIQELNIQGESKIAGINVAIGYGQGIADTEAMRQVVFQAKNLAGAAIAAMQTELDEHSPSKKAEQIGAYVPEGFVLGIKKGQSKAVKSVEDMSRELVDALSWSDPLNKIDGSINRRITNATRTIFTTPNIQFNVQTLNKENLDLAFNYINKKFGSQY